MRSDHPPFRPASFAEVFAASPWPMLMLAESGEILAASDDGTPPEVGELPLRERARDYLALLRGEPPWLTPQQAESARRRPSGEVISERLHLRRTPWGASLVVVDQTAEKREQATDLQTTRLAALGFMVAGVCHEITNPLTSLHSIVQILAKEQPPDPALLERGLRNIGDNVQRLLTISRRLVKFSRVGEEPRVSICIDEAVDEALSVLQQGALMQHVELLRSQDRSARVVGHAGQIREVLLNLLANALQAMQGRGRLELATRIDGTDVVVSVRDSGPGVAREALDRLFEPFFTTRPDADGTGLGLAISREIAGEHGGDVVLLQSTAEGAVFGLRLPGAPSP